MKQTDDITCKLGRQIVELTLVGMDGGGLDQLLERLIYLFENADGIPVVPKGVILLLNPRKELVQVAQYGLFEKGEEDPLHRALDGVVPEFRPNAYVTSLAEERGDAWSGEQDERLLVLPLSEGRNDIGVVILSVDSTWDPTADNLNFVTDIAHVVTGVISRCLVSEVLKIRELELEDARADAIRRLGTASEYRDNETGMHVMRMTHYSAAIAKAMNMPVEEREKLVIAAPMHDVGKIGISDYIMLKPGKLTGEEYEVMKTHTTIGGKLLTGKDPLIVAAREIALSHHEHWDGSGYPGGLAQEEIPIFGRICSIADVFDALVSDRPYKKPWPVEKAVDWIKQEAGKKFDPEVVRAFEKALPDILRIKELYRDDVIDPNQVVQLPEVMLSNKEWVSWNSSLSVGIDVIDEHHRYLIDLVNDLYEVVKNKKGAREVVRVLNALSQYAKIHFQAEEKMMEHYGFSAIDRQKHQHKYFENKLEKFYDELHTNPLTIQFDILVYLRNWLVKHIMIDDAQLSELVVQS